MQLTGKSDALLMAALQYFDQPGYNGIIFRLSMRDAEMSESIQNRCREWLAPFIKLKQVRYVGKTNTFHSVEGGTLTFGYLANLGDENGYQGGAWHFIGFDETTQFNPYHYTYMFSRCRRKKGDQLTVNIPLRIRAACNPGGQGHGFIKNRFDIRKDENGRFRGFNPSKPFIQSRIWDNPHLEQASYEENLDELDETTKARLKEGDWDASPDAVFKDDWFEHRWISRGQDFNLIDNIGVYNIPRNKLTIFLATDVAGSEKEGLEGRVLSTNRNAQPCWSVCGVFGLFQDELIWIDNIRTQSTVPDFIDKVASVFKYYRPAFVISENNSINLPFIQSLRRKGIPVVERHNATDKIVRSIPAQVRAKNRHVWLPRDAEWLPDLESELFIWTGRKAETDDQIDVLSLAGIAANEYRQTGDLDPLLASSVQPSAPLATSGLVIPATEGAFDRGSRSRSRGLSNLVGLRGA